MADLLTEYVHVKDINTQRPTQLLTHKAARYD